MDERSKNKETTKKKRKNADIEGFNKVAEHSFGSHGSLIRDNWL